MGSLRRGDPGLSDRDWDDAQDAAMDYDDYVG